MEQAVLIQVTLFERDDSIIWVDEKTSGVIFVLEEVQLLDKWRVLVALRIVWITVAQVQRGLAEWM